MSIDLPKVNILVISYNQEDLIEESVMSCINQDYKNLMVVVSDDGSKDSTPIILLNLQKRYPDRLKVILNKENKGITKNCNLGLSHCEHDLIAFAAGDDVLYKNKISLQVAAFLDNPDLALCYHPVHILINNKVVAVSGNKYKDKVNNFYEMISKYGAEISGSVVMVAKAAIPSGGFNESLNTASDWLFYIQASSKGRVLRIDHVLSKYRKHDNNIGHKVFDYADDFLNTLSFVLCEYPGDHKVVDSVNRGKRRFLLGIIYNAIVSGNSSAFDKYSEVYRNSGYFGGRVLPVFNGRLARVFLIRVKRMIKLFL